MRISSNNIVAFAVAAVGLVGTLAVFFVRVGFREPPSGRALLWLWIGSPHCFLMFLAMLLRRDAAACWIVLFTALINSAFSIGYLLHCSAGRGWAGGSIVFEAMATPVLQWILCIIIGGMLFFSRPTPKKS